MSDDEDACERNARGRLVRTWGVGPDEVARLIADGATAVSTTMRRY